MQSITYSRGILNTKKMVTELPYSYNRSKEQKPATGYSWDQLF